MLSVCTSSTDLDLTTTGNLRLALFGTTVGSTSDDPNLSSLIRRASLWAETYIGSPLTFQSYVETVAAFGTQSLMLSRTPVRSVMDLFSDPNTTTPETCSSYRVEDSDAGIIQRDYGFDWTMPIKYGLGPKLIPGLEQRPWRVEYTAGYSYAGVASTWDGVINSSRTLPDDIEQAVILKCVEWYTGKDRIASKTVGDMSITYRSESGGEAERLLEPYRRIGIVV